MTRVSENSSTSSLNFAISRAKSRMEDLQTKGSTLKSITKPSDAPISNVEALAISSENSDIDQFQKNGNIALLHLNVTERAIEDLTDILTKAKEIAIAQSSDIYNAGVRESVANEVIQLRNQALSLANKRIGNKYIFSGYASLTAPFTKDGAYHGDTGKINLEISKDFFIPINLHGGEVFLNSEKIDRPITNPIKALKQEEDGKEQNDPSFGVGRNLASVADNFENHDNIFHQLNTLVSALENNDPDTIQDLLPKLDTSVDRLITVRTRVGSLTNSIERAQNTLEKNFVDNSQRKSHLVDADIAELFGEITKQQQILKTTYQSGKGLMNKTLLDFIR